jgi:hypothetical protein
MAPVVDVDDVLGVVGAGNPTGQSAGLRDRGACLLQGIRIPAASAAW